ncbi:MAG: hypothetical protein V3S37_04825 [Dehalococcoidia bacterium]
MRQPERNEIIIQATDLVRRFQGGGTDVFAVRDVNLDVSRG